MVVYRGMKAREGGRGGREGEGRPLTPPQKEKNSFVSFRPCHHNHIK